jgi:preprotein translocase SecE subunit
VLSRSIRRVRRFFDESVSELKKVSWPTVEQTRNLTVLVIAVSFGVGVYVAFFDTVFRFILGLVSKVSG